MLHQRPKKFNQAKIRFVLFQFHALSTVVYIPLQTEIVKSFVVNLPHRFYPLCLPPQLKRKED